MYRSHNLLRKATRRRKARREAIPQLGWFDGVKTLKPLCSVLRAVEDDGYLDPTVLDRFEDRLVSGVMGFIEESGILSEVGVGVATEVFGAKQYHNRLDRQLAVGSSAVALSAVEERVWLAMHYAMRLLAARLPEAAPCYPRGSVIPEGAGVLAEGDGDASDEDAAEDGGSEDADGEEEAA